jgi:hypothetical protein
LIQAGGSSSPGTQSAKEDALGLPLSAMENEAEFPQLLELSPVLLELERCRFDEYLSERGMAQRALGD